MIVSACISQILDGKEKSGYELGLFVRCVLVTLQFRQTIRFVWFAGVLFVYGKVVKVTLLAECQGDDIHGGCLCDAGDS